MTTTKKSLVLSVAMVVFFSPHRLLSVPSPRDVVFAKTLKGYSMLFYFYRNFMTSPQRHEALVLLSYFVLMFLKVLHWLRDKNTISDLSIRRLAFYVRKHILIGNITIILKTTKIQFKQNILDTYFDPIYPIYSIESVRL